MTIKTEMILSTMLSIALALALGLILVLSHIKMHANAEAERFIDTIVEEVFELNIITNAYVSSRSKSSEFKWESMHDTIFERLQHGDILDHYKTGVHTRFAANLESAKGIFVQLQRTADNTDIDVRLSDQLTFKLQAIVSNAFETKGTTRAHLHKDQIQANLLFTLAVVLLILVSIMNAIFTNNSVAKPVLVLQKGAEIIGSGNLDYTVGTTGKDEIGELTRAFDAMTEKLKISKNKTESYSKDLEQKSRELQERVTELERYQDATVDRELRMKELRDKIEELEKRLREKA